MFRIRQIHDAASPQDQTALSAVLQLYEEAFSYCPQYTAKIAEFLKFSSKHDFDIVLLVAEGSKNRILGFTLTFFFPRKKYGYLDYIISDPKRSHRGYGTALYEATREWLLQNKCKGLFMDVPPDEKELLKDKSRLKINQKRMEFYERFGALPIVNTKYEHVFHPANQGFSTLLVFDRLGQQHELKASALKLVITRILSIKGNMDAKDPKLQEILSSVKDNPVQLRKLRYHQSDAPVISKQKHYLPLDFVTTGDAHQIHHLREKGYVERPARVQFIEKGLSNFDLQRHTIKHFAEKNITEVHRPALVKFLKKAMTELEPGQLVYPNVFPIRKPERIPKTWEMQAGYYCIDTFTPVTANAYKAARIAVDAALTGAELITKGKQVCYVLGRPPGHHAEPRAFGGFCYFNQASIAAHYLSKQGKVAFIDIDYHHGNGSQEIFYARNDVFFISIHGHPRASYPYFAGFSDERGIEKGKGFNKNYPLYPGVNDKAYMEVLEDALGIFKRYKPDYLVISLGFDIMAGDPTGSFTVSPKGMKRIGELFKSLNLPTLIVQEGGYALRNLRTGAEGFFQGILG